MISTSSVTKVRSAAAVGLAMALAVGCTAGTPPQGAAPATASTASPAAAAPATPAGPTGTVTIALSSFSGEKLDPSLDSGALPYSGPMFDPLVGAKPSGELNVGTGVLASYTSDPTAKMWTLTLKQGIKWHDGSDLTSADLKFTLDYNARKEATCVSCSILKRELDRVEVVDRSTVRMHLKNAYVQVPELVLGMVAGTLRVLPKDYLEKVGPEGFTSKPMGSGPWKFVGRRIGEFIEYEANTQYWDSSRVPKFSKLRIVLVPEAATREAMLKRSEADIAVIEAPQLKQLDGSFKIIPVKDVGSTVLTYFNTYDSRYICNKVEFRKALTLAIDMNAVVKAFYPEQVAVRYGGAALFTPLALGHDTSLAPYPYDVAEAKRALAASGYKGEEITYWSVTRPSNPEQREVDQVIASYWRAIGVNVKLVPSDWNPVQAKAFQNPQPFEPPCNVVALAPSGDRTLAERLRDWLGSRSAGGSYLFYSDPAAIDKVVVDLRTTPMDAWAAQLTTLNKKLYNEYWAIPIVLKNALYAAGPKVADWQTIRGAWVSLPYETILPKR